MTTRGSGRRVLRFAVTGALLGGGLGCDGGNDTKSTTPPAADAKQTPQPSNVPLEGPENGERLVPKTEGEPKAGPPLGLDDGEGDEGEDGEEDMGEEDEPEEPRYVNEGPEPVPEPAPEPEPKLMVNPQQVVPPKPPATP